MSLTENTQLTQVPNLNTDNLIFSKPVVSTIAGSAQMTYNRITISVKNPDGTCGNLVVCTEKLFSFGVGTNALNDDPKDGYRISLSMHARDAPSDAEMAWIAGFNKIVEKCKQHLLQVKDQVGLFKLSETHSLFDAFNPVKYKIDKKTGDVVKDMPPILSVKLVSRKGEIVSLFNDERGNKMDPMSLFKKTCHMRAAIRVEAIFITAKCVALQLRLHEAQVKVADTGFKSLLAPIASPESRETKSPLDDDDEFEDDDIIV